MRMCEDNDYNHEDIVYEGMSCPLCEALYSIENLEDKKRIRKNKVEELEDVVLYAEEKVSDLEDEVKELKARVEELEEKDDHAGIIV